MAGDNEEPVYRVSEGDYYSSWRDLSRKESHRPPERDIEITGLRAMEIAGNFTWGIAVVETDADFQGIGEFARVSAATVENMGETLVGENPHDVTRLAEQLDGDISAIAGIETALWDLKGKLLDTPLYELLGGKYRDRIKIYNDTHGGVPFGHATSRDPTEIYTPEAVAAAARDVVDEGFEGLKFDIDVPTEHDSNTTARWLSNESIEHKVAMIEAVRDEIGYGVDLGVDLHGEFTVESAIRLGKKLEPFDLAWYEDPTPTDRREATKRVREKVSIPVLVGGTWTPVDFKDALVDGTIDLGHPDLIHCGGVRNLVQIAKHCDLYGVPIVVHNMFSPVATVAGAHVCAAVSNVHSMEYHSREVPWWDEMASRTGGSGPILADGYIDLPEGPGLGVELNLDVIEDNLVEGSELVA